MKRNLSSLLLLLVLVLSLCLPVLADDTIDYVQDETDLLTSSEWEALNNYAGNLAKQFNCAVCLVIMDDYTYAGPTMEQACDNLYAQRDLGSTTDGNAILLLMSMGDRQWWLRSYGDFGIVALTTTGGEKLSDDFLPYLGDNDWFGGFSAYYEGLYTYLESAQNGHPLYSDSYFYWRYVSFSIIPAVLIAFLVCSIFKRRMKSARKQQEAQAYIPDGGVLIRVATDRYTHTTTTRTKIESESSSSGGGDSGGSSDSGCSTGGSF